MTLKEFLRGIDELTCSASQAHFLRVNTSKLKPLSNGSLRQLLEMPRPVVGRTPCAERLNACVWLIPTFFIYRALAEPVKMRS